ncbi:hypothetical protein F5Y04DRAFT_270258 [Hypomontagnella monticulosa]|nr:hypothetical protein F5Y04DRAFT_270258 [Hypomontagnella monticulosa]
MFTLIQQLCRSLQTPAVTKRYQDAGLGLILIILTQLLVIPIQIALDLHSINLPASILVMLLVSLLMLIANRIHGNTARLYTKHLRGPTDFLGRHMSFGFVASFIMLNRDHITNAIDIPRVAGAFLVTTIIGYLSSFAVASGSFKLEQRVRGSRSKLDDPEANNKSWPSPSTTWLAPPADRCPMRLAQLSRISDALAKNGSLSSIESAKSVSSSQLADILVRTAPLSICVFLVAVVGIPIYSATSYEMPFEALCFILFWILSVQFQRSLKNSVCLLRVPRLRSIFVIFANPVLVTWALGTAYLWIKTAYTNQTIDITISEFRRHETLAECIIAIIKGASTRESIGAGDLASLVLDAGIVCMGFKMFEYRKELWESIVTVFTTSAILAVENVFLNVLLARAFGLQTSDAVSFAARSVTIALGVPAIENLDGSTTLMSAMVIFGGIIFQMAGDGLFSLLRIKDRKGLLKSDSSKDSDTEKSDVGHGGEPQQGTGTDNGVISAGVTVGINAAAMGTAHLMERDSKATAYSALSMTVFGAMTVALTALPGVSKAIIALASR